MEPLAPTLRSIAADWLKKSDPAAVPVVLWPMVCGESVAARTSAKSFADGELKIAVPDRQWADQLREFVPRYLAAINEVAPAKVKAITFEAPAGQ
jgi:Dna[CI] antecedent, DciA